MLVLRHQDKLRRDLAELGQWHERIRHHWPKQVIHGDYVTKNIVFDSKGLAGVLDLGSARLDLRILDLARALQSFARRGRWGMGAPEARIFLNAYRTCLPLTDDEVALVPRLLQWRLLRMIVWRLRDDLPPSRKLASFRHRWDRVRWLERHGEAFLDALLAPSGI